MIRHYVGFERSVMGVLLQGVLRTETLFRAGDVLVGIEIAGHHSILMV
ncbi:hypothetical protein ANAPC1_00739 [Anaplasma phagocytophilum]|uniref:Uncharacterized protein n=1 Tax=Anaplasma phagocytophilum TaxID=948 RepID=A0AA45UT80_ANAPH|nr:hypothetical protein [Anaplasma phagocytophilum]SBO14387.1 hypothetical protein ANAPC1_00739 [Anaplasma phagocytophilum]